MTQEELAESSNVNIRTIQRIENGEVSPRSDTITLLSNALNIDPELLFEPRIVTDNTTIYVMYALGLTSIIYPVLGIIVPLFVWLVYRNKVHGINKYAMILMVTQICWLIVYLLMAARGFNGVSNISYVSPKIITDLLINVLVLRVIDVVLILGGIVYIMMSTRKRK